MTATEPQSPESAAKDFGTVSIHLEPSSIARGPRPFDARDVSPDRWPVPLVLGGNSILERATHLAGEVALP